MPVLDGLRAVSILLVLATHMLPVGPKAWQLNDATGNMGMSLFFALSGFLIVSLLLADTTVPEFLVRRLARILPLAYAYTFVVFVLVSFDPARLFWTNTFLMNYVDPLNNLIDINAHFWSLCVEMQFYACIALVVFVLGRRGLWLVFPACIAITLIRIGHGATVDIRTHHRVDEILAGACVAMLYRPDWSRFKRMAVVALPAILVLWFLSANWMLEPLGYFRPYFSSALLVAALCLQNSAFGRFLASKTLGYIATISYALYIIHPATIHGWLNEGGPAVKYLLKRPVSFAVTFALAHVSTFYWESYWQDAGRRLIRRWRSGSAGIAV